jgi:hypothetical protein
MKKSFLVLFVASMSVGLYGQLLKENIYDLNGNDRLDDMIVTSDGNLLLCSNSDNGIYLMKTDLSGEIIWEKPYNWGDASKVYQLTETIGGKFVIVGSYGDNALMMGLDTFGDSLWSVIEEGSPELPRSWTTVESFSNGNLLVSNKIDQSYYQAPPSSSIFITDSFGNQITGSLGGTDVGYVTQTKILNDTVFVSTTSVWLIPNGTYLAKTSTSGTFLTSYFLELVYTKGFVADENENTYLTVNGFNTDMIKLNDIGETIWSNSYFPDFYTFTQNSCLNDTLLFVTGSISTSPDIQSNNALFVVLADTSGQLHNSYTNEGYYNQVGQRIEVLGDNIFVAGNVIIEEGVYDLDIFLNIFSIDSLYTSIENKKQINYGRFSVYPNPVTQGQVTFGFENTTDQNDLELKCFDLYGKEIFSKNIYGHQTESVVDLSRFNEGMYVAVIYSKGFPVGECKFIIQ